MKTKQTRLSLLSTEAEAHLATRSAEELRRLAGKAPRFAFDSIGFDRAVDLAPHNELTRAQHAALLQLEVDEMDQLYFDLAAAHEAGNVAEHKVLAAFSRARALNAAVFALNADPFIAAAEAAYEAHAATNDLRGLLLALELTRNDG